MSSSASIRIPLVGQFTPWVDASEYVDYTVAHRLPQTDILTRLSLGMRCHQCHYRRHVSLSVCRLMPAKVAAFDDAVQRFLEEHSHDGEEARDRGTRYPCGELLEAMCVHVG